MTAEEVRWCVLGGGGLAYLGKGTESRPSGSEVGARIWGMILKSAVPSTSVSGHPPQSGPRFALVAEQPDTKELQDYLSPPP